MKTLNHIKEEIKMEMAKGIEASISKTEALLSTESSLHSDLLQIKGRYADSQRKFQMGLIPYEATSLVANQVRYALLTEIVGRLEIDDFKDHYKPEEKIPDKPITQLPFDLKIPRFKMDVLRLDRRKAASLFRARFDLLKDIPVQHYFIYGDRHQQPRSLVERLVFEMESNARTLQYDAEGDKHIRIVEPETEGNLAVSKLSFCEYFSERFGTTVSTLADIPVSPSTEGNDQYVITVFKFHIKEWKDYSKAIFEWLLSTFCKTSDGASTKFIFFHVLQKDSFSARAKGSLLRILGGKPGKQKRVETMLEGFKKHPNCTVLPELKPISIHDLTKWLEEFISNETVIDKLLKDISGGKKFKDALDMSFVENQLVNILHQ
ncbi:MAG: hypothetical protein DWQ02_03090 [Bacteroidetes bacterium]|nr:MAG: hypothetical protein DWQ02_03090 [Bacteroidota bacterium]